jgi:hypothetical protein
LTKAEKEWRRSPVGYKHSILIHQRTSDGGESLATFRDVNIVGDEFLQAAHMPKALPRDRTLDDLAVVYIRHGEPSREIFPNLSRAGYNKTWLYDKNEQHPEMVFHFQRLGEHTGWILEAVPGNTENLETLHGRYIQLQDVETDDSDDEYESDGTGLRPQARGWAQEIMRENLTYLERAMTTETSSYTTPETPIQLPYQYLMFKGEDKSEVELFYLIHGGIVDLDSVQNKVDVDEYITIHNDKWDEVQRFTRKVERTMNLSPQQWAGSGFAMREFFSLDPGDYFTELQAVDNVGLKRAIHKDTLYVPDFFGDQLMVSDVIIASEIDEAQSSPFERNGVPFNPHMFYGFPSNGFVGIYFEIYNLKLDEAGTTRYEVSFTMQRSDLQEREQNQTVLGFVKNLFMDKRQVSSRFENEGRTGDDYIYMNLQFPDRKSGQYDLIIRVKDMQSGQVTSTQAKITLL